jgi:hypothetical protein
MIRQSAASTLTLTTAVLAGIVLGSLGARTSAAAPIAPSGFRPLAECSTTQTTTFSVTTPAPQGECPPVNANPSGRKFWIEVNTEHCLRTARLTCTMNVGGVPKTIINSGELYLDPGVLTWLSRGLCVTDPAIFQISPLNPMACTLTTDGGTGMLWTGWSSTRTPCCYPSCGTVGGESESDYRPVGDGLLSTEYPCGTSPYMQLDVFASWCSSVHLVRLVCEMSSGVVRAWDFYNFNFDGPLDNKAMSFCFSRDGYPNYPTSCHLIAYGGNFTEGAFDSLTCLPTSCFQTP